MRHPTRTWIIVGCVLIATAVSLSLSWRMTKQSQKTYGMYSLLQTRVPIAQTPTAPIPRPTSQAPAAGEPLTEHVLVMEWQRCLAMLGFYQGPQHGEFDGPTVRAVNDYATSRFGPDAPKKLTGDAVGQAAMVALFQKLERECEQTFPGAFKRW